MPIFKSRSAPNRPRNAMSEAKSRIEQQVEKEIAIMSVAIPFLPRDQVCGLVLKKLGLEAGTNGKTLLRKGGARIDFKNVNVTVPRSPGERAGGMEAPRNIRKRLLGHSEGFRITRIPSLQAHREKKPDNVDSFCFVEDPSADIVPKIKHRVPPKKLEDQRQKKTPKKRLFSCEASWTEDIDDITDAFDSLISDQVVGPPTNYGRTAKIKKTKHKAPKVLLTPRRNPPEQRRRILDISATNGKALTRKASPPLSKNHPPMQVPVQDRRRASEDESSTYGETLIRGDSPDRYPLQMLESPKQRRRTPEDESSTDGEMLMREDSPSPDRNPPPVQESSQQRRRTSEDESSTDGKTLMREDSPSPDRNPPPVQESPQQRRRTSEDESSTDGKTLMSEDSPSPDKNPPPMQESPQQQRRRTSEDESSTDGDTLMRDDSPSPDRYPSQIPESPEQRRRTPEDESSTDGETLMREDSPSPDRNPPPMQESAQQQRRRTSEDESSTDTDTLMDDSPSPDRYPTLIPESPDQRRPTSTQISATGHETLSKEILSPISLLRASCLATQSDSWKKPTVPVRAISGRSTVHSLPQAAHSLPLELGTQDELFSRYRLNSTLNPASQIPLKPYSATQRGSSADISRHSSASNKSALAAPSGASTADSLPQAAHSLPLELGTQEEPFSTCRSNSTLNPASQTPLRPYSATQRGSSAEISVYTNESKKSAFTAPLDPPTVDPENSVFQPYQSSPLLFATQEETPPGSADRCTNLSVLAGASSHSENVDDPSPTNSSSLDSASQINLKLKRQQASLLKGDNSITTPTTGRPPYRGPSTRKGQPWTKQVPAEKITCRRAFYPRNISGSSQDFSPKECSGHGGNSFMIVDRETGRLQPLHDAMTVEEDSRDDDLMIVEEENDEPDEVDSPIDSPTKRLNRSAIPVTPLLLKRGADRLDGLPFSSGEAVRPDAAEWLHLKKLSQGNPSAHQPSPKTPTKTSVFPPAYQRQARAVIPAEAYCAIRMTAEADLPAETAKTSPVLESSEDLCTQTSNMSSQKSANWWLNADVLNALRGLGVEELDGPNSQDFSATQPVSQTTQQTKLIQAGRVRGKADVPFSGQGIQEAVVGSRESISTPASSVGRWVSPSNGVLKISQQSNKSIQTRNAPVLSPDQMTEMMSLHSDLSSEASFINRNVSFSFRKRDAPVSSPTQMSEISMLSDLSSEASLINRYVSFSLRKK